MRMGDNYNYPMGADTKDAPWNEPIIPKRDFNVDVTFVLTKTCKITTDDYIQHCDDDGGSIYADTKHTDLGDAYEESGNFTIPELLKELKDYVQADMETCSPNTGKCAYLKRLLAACDGWTVVDENYVEL